MSSENQVQRIDLASILEDDANYYYDPVHYTYIGTKRIAEIIAGELFDQLGISN